MSALLRVSFSRPVVGCISSAEFDHSNELCAFVKTTTYPAQKPTYLLDVICFREGALDNRATEGHDRRTDLLFNREALFGS